MTFFEIFIIVCVLIIVFSVIYFVFSRKTEKNINNSDELIRENERLTKDLAQNNKELDNVKTEKNHLEGENKELNKNFSESKIRLETAREKFSEQQKHIAKFEEAKERKEKEFLQKTEQLENSRKTLEDEKVRIQREDETKQAKILDEKNRVWNDHENNIVSSLRNICQKPEISFDFYDNTNLPADFAGNFKPDGLVEFLGYYILFDAKFSNQKDPNAYLKEQVKKTAEKIKSQDQKIYQMVFLVIPENRLDEIRQTSFSEKGFVFFIISQKSLEPILFSFKRISEYENLKDFTPEDREKIVNLISEYDKHISFQNAANILLAKKSISLMNEKKDLPNDFQDDIENKKKNISEMKLKPTEIKSISQNIETQTQKIDELTKPQIAISKKNIKTAKDSFDFES